MRSLALVVAACVGLSASAATADQVVMEYNSIYSGNGVPANGSPFARATFTSNTPGTVTLFLEGLLGTNEFVSNFFFNFDPSLSLASLSVSHTAGTEPSSNGMKIGPANNHKAGGGGKYDILFKFPTSNANRFNGTDTATFTFTSSQAINANSFNFIGAPHGGEGPFLTAAHFQGLGQNCDRSAWISGEEQEEQQLTVVPLPPAAWAGLASLAGVAGFGAIRRRTHR